MDVRSRENSVVEGNHQNTAPTWWLVTPRELRAATIGGYLELVGEFEVAEGGAIHPHAHPTHEFYYVAAGSGEMIIGKECRPVGPGDLIRIPPNEVHSLRAAATRLLPGLRLWAPRCRRDRLYHAVDLRRSAEKETM